MFSVAAVNIMGRAESGYKNFDDNADNIALGAEDQLIGWNNYQYFGTVSRSLMTLMNLVIMAELDTILRPVWEVQPVVAMVLLCLAFLFTFCFFNILIGMIMDSVMQSVSQLESEATRKERRRQMDYAHQLAKIMFDQESGKVNHHMSHGLQKTHGSHLNDLSDCINELGLPHGFSLEDLFDMFDIDGKRQATADDCLNCIFNLVTNNTFQTGCQLYKGIGQIKRKMHMFEESIRAEMAVQHKEVLAEIRRATVGSSPKSVASAGDGVVGQGTSIQIQCRASNPELKVPDFQMPERKVGTEPLNATEFKMPEVSAELLKVTEFKMPEATVPEFKEEASQAIAQIEEVITCFNRRHGLGPHAGTSYSAADHPSSGPQSVNQASVPDEPSSAIGPRIPTLDLSGVEQSVRSGDT